MKFNWLIFDLAYQGEKNTPVVFYQKVCYYSSITMYNLSMCDDMYNCTVQRIFM